MTSGARKHFGQEFTGGNGENGVQPTRRLFRSFTEGNEGNEDPTPAYVTRFVGSADFSTTTRSFYREAAKEREDVGCEFGNPELETRNPELQFFCHGWHG